MSFQSINPATGELIEDYGEDSPGSIHDKLEASKQGFSRWKEVSLEERSRLMRSAGAMLRDRKEEYASLITSEMGKPVSQASAEIEKSALVCDYYAEEARRFLTPETFPTEAKESFVRYDPLGPILAIMPWNFPFWQVFRFAAPNLMAGNTGILKHAPNVPGSALAIEQLFREVGFPEGAFINLFAGIKETEKAILDDRVRGVTLTGSENAGRHVAAASGRGLKKTVLELGGSDPFIVLQDADLDAAVKAAVTSRTQNSGQSCIAAKRFIVIESRAEAFLEKFESALKNLRQGDPTKEDTDIGPMARGDLRDEIHRQLQETKQQGAVLHLGGEMPDGPGYFYPVTLVSKVRPVMVAARQETFGPLAAVIPVKSAEEAVVVANDTPYGLGASLWTRDLELAKRMAGRIEAGSVFINAMVKSDPRLPFGGIKNSGYGRELSRDGIREFTNIKTVLVAN